MINLDDLIKELNNDIVLLDQEIDDVSNQLKNSATLSTLSLFSTGGSNQAGSGAERNNQLVDEYNSDLERINKGIAHDIDGFLRDFNGSRDQLNSSLNSLVSSKNIVVQKDNKNQQIHSSPVNGADIDIVHAFTEWRVLIDEEVEELYLLVKKLKKNSKIYNNLNKSIEAPGSPVLTTREKHPELYMHNSTFTNILQLKNDLICIIKQFEKKQNTSSSNDDQQNGDLNHGSEVFNLGAGNGSGMLSKAVSNPDMNSLIPASLKMPPAPNTTTTANISSSTGLHINTHTSVSSRSAPSSPRQRSISSTSSPSNQSSPSTSSSTSPSSSPSPSRRSNASFMQTTQSSSNKLSGTSQQPTPSKTSNRLSNSHLTGTSQTTSISHPSTPTKTTTRGRANSTSTPIPQLALTSPFSSPVKKSNPNVKPLSFASIESTTPPFKQSVSIRKPQASNAKQLNRTHQEQEEDVKIWIQKVLDCPLEELSHHPYEEPLLNHLQSGVVLCRLLNALEPDRIKKIIYLPQPYFQVNNIDLFIRECASLGVDKNDMFDPFDLHNLKDSAVKPVISTIYSLARATNHLDELRNISNAS